jgi:hypothetical protein
VGQVQNDLGPGKYRALVNHAHVIINARLVTRLFVGPPHPDGLIAAESTNIDRPAWRDRGDYIHWRGHRYATSCTRALLLRMSVLGGIKANVSTFVADQIRNADELTTERVFRLFYLCINIGR